MSNFVRTPIDKKMNRLNILSRLERQERKTDARSSARVADLSEFNGTIDHLLTEIDITYPPYYRMSAAQTDLFGSVDGATPYNVEAIGSGAAPPIASEADHPGIIQFKNGGVANGGGRIRLANNSYLIIQGGEVFECVVRPLSDAAQCETYAGFMDSVGTSAPTNGIYFKIVGKAGTSTAGVSVHTVNTVPASETQFLGGGDPAINTWVRLKFVVNQDATSVDFYLYDDDGTLIDSATLSTGIPAGASYPADIIVKAFRKNDTSTNISDVDWISWYSTRNLLR